RRDEIASTKLSGVHADFRGRLVDEAFDGVCDIGPACAAIRADRCGVRDRYAIGSVKRRTFVDARHAVGGIANVPLRARREIRAEIDDPVDAYREELPILVERELTVRDHV